jgi:hypothetical protein
MHLASDSLALQLHARFDLGSWMSKHVQLPCPDKPTDDICRASSDGRWMPAPGQTRLTKWIETQKLRHSGNGTRGELIWEGTWCRCRGPKYQVLENSTHKRKGALCVLSDQHPMGTESTYACEEPGRTWLKVNTTMARSDARLRPPPRIEIHRSDSPVRPPTLANARRRRRPLAVALCPRRERGYSPSGVHPLLPPHPKRRLRHSQVALRQTGHQRSAGSPCSQVPIN